MPAKDSIVILQPMVDTRNDLTIGELTNWISLKTHELFSNFASAYVPLTANRIVLLYVAMLNSVLGVKAVAV